MKFFTAQIDRAFFDENIKSEIPAGLHFGDLIQCFIIEANIPAVGDSELWLCGNQFYPAVIYRRTVCERTEYAQDDFMKLIPERDTKDVLDYIEMLKPSYVR